MAFLHAFRANRLALLVLPLLLSGAVVPSYAQQCEGPYAAQTKYIGCYTDNGDFRTLQSETLTFSDTNGPQLCANICGHAGFNISGVEFTSQCFCGHYIEDTAVHVAETDCTSKCPGEPSQICGGSNRINLYQILNPDPIVTQNPGVPNCRRDPLCSTGVCDTSKSITDRATGFVNLMTLQEKIANLNSNAPGTARLGMPPINWWNEALHGLAFSPGTGVVVNNRPLNFSGATAFPCPISIGASFNVDLFRQVGTIIGTEARAFDNSGFAGLSFFTPNINEFRNALWGRGQETPGEDPFLTSQYAIGLVTGLQGTDPDYFLALATCKHYAAYDVEVDRFANDVKVSMQDLADYFLPAFRACVADARAASVMCAYTAVNGTPSCADSWLLQDVLRDGFGFGEAYNYVVSDCDAVDSASTGLHLEPNLTAAAADTMNAGMDLDCGATLSNNLNTALDEGLTTEAVIDKALIRLIAALIKAGWFNQPEQFSGFTWKDVNTPASQQTAYQAAAEGVVLLKNTEGVLPITKPPSSVLVVGPYGNATTQMQGNYFGTPASDIISPLAAVQSAWPSANVQFAQGVGISSSDTSGIAPALALARNVDLILFWGGLDKTLEDENLDRTNLQWPGQQEQLITQLSQLGKPLVVVQFGGGQLDDSALLADPNVHAILWAGYPGQAGGPALVDTITGANPPAGRLPITQYPSSYLTTFKPLNLDIRAPPGQTYMWYQGDPVLPFGFGQHYTSFELFPTGAPFPSTDIASLPDNVTVSFNVKNVGSLASDYVALLFFSSCSGPDASPIKKLVAFKRLKAIKPGETVRADLLVETKLLARADVNGTSFINPGYGFLALDVVNSVAQGFTLSGSAKQVGSLPPQK